MWNMACWIQTDLRLELQTFRTQDLSFPKRKVPMENFRSWEFSFPGTKKRKFTGPFVTENFRSHICVCSFITAV